MCVCIIGGLGLLWSLLIQAAFIFALKWRDHVSLHCPLLLLLQRFQDDIPTSSRRNGTRTIRAEQRNSSDEPPGKPQWLCSSNLPILLTGQRIRPRAIHQNVAQGDVSDGPKKVFLYSIECTVPGAHRLDADSQLRSTEVDRRDSPISASPSYSYIVCRKFPLI